MPVFHKHKIIFFHIGKTGGFSIEKALGIGQLDYKVFDEQYVHGLKDGVMTQHARPEYIREVVGDEQFKEYFKFTVVRNPWDRMVSAFKYLHTAHVKRFNTFDAWLEHKHKMVIEKRYREGSHYAPQIEYLTDTGGYPVCDRVIRFENLFEGYDQICKRFGIKNTLKHLNKSKDRTRYIDFYKDRTKDLVQEMYPEDIERFQYKYG